MGRDGGLERVGVVVVMLLWVLLQGSLSTSPGDPEALAASGQERTPAGLTASAGPATTAPAPCVAGRGS